MFRELYRNFKVVADFLYTMFIWEYKCHDANQLCPFLYMDLIVCSHIEALEHFI